MVDEIPDERPTLVTCLACGGSYKRVYTNEDGTHGTSVCAWCTFGSMTAAQVARWAARRQGRNR